MRSTELKSLSPELLKRVDELGAWPRGKQFMMWVRDEGRSIRNEKYTALRNGKPVDVQVIASLLSYITRPEGAADNDQPEAKVRKAALECVAQFLSDQGVPEPLSLTPSQMLPYVCSGPHALPTVGISYKAANLFLRGISSLSLIVRTKRQAHRHICWTSDARAIGQALLWFFHDGGSLGASTQPPDFDPVSALEQRFRMTLAQYQEFVMVCLHKAPWTFVLARGKDRITGVSLVLPVSEKTYNAIRSGQLMSCHITGNDIVVPSRFLVQEALSARPVAMGGESIDLATRALSWCVLTQLGVLSRFKLSTDPKESPIRILGVAGTPDAREGLTAFGYKPTGTHMAISGEALYEKIVHPTPKSADILFAMVMASMGGYFLGPPPT